MAQKPTWSNTIAPDVVEVAAGPRRRGRPKGEGLEELGLLPGDEIVASVALLQVLLVAVGGQPLGVDVGPTLFKFPFILNISGSLNGNACLNLAFW